jgi:hypothetical protein
MGEHREVVGPVLADPAVGDQLDGDGVEIVQLLAPRPAGDDEAGVFENTQVPHHPEPRHLLARGQVAERAAVALEEPVEEVTARGVGEGLEHAVIVISHRAYNM